MTVLLVDKAYRKHGIGHTLMAWAESWSREQGCDRMEISARKESGDSLAFLLKLGYEDTSRRFFKHLSGGGQKGEV